MEDGDTGKSLEMQGISPAVRCGVCQEPMSREPPRFDPLSTCPFLRFRLQTVAPACERTRGGQKTRIPQHVYPGTRMTELSNKVRPVRRLGDSMTGCEHGSLRGPGAQGSRDMQDAGTYNDARDIRRGDGIGGDSPWCGDARVAIVRIPGYERG